MRDNTPLNRDVPGKRLQIICFAALLTTLVFSARDLYADRLSECVMEAFNQADDSVTVGQIREQCRQESSAVEQPEAPVPAGSAGSSAGPVEIILKTPQARKPAYFPHQRHQEKYSCGTCHHGQDSSGRLVKYTATTINSKCTSCHNSTMPNPELNDFQLIGHKLCRECHRTNQDITSARCSTCHRRNE